MNINIRTIQEKKPSSVNIGFADYARREISVNFFMNLICAKCPNVGFIHDMGNVVMKIACIYILITRARSKNAHGTREDSASMVSAVTNYECIITDMPGM